MVKESFVQSTSKKKAASEKKAAVGKKGGTTKKATTKSNAASKTTRTPKAKTATKAAAKKTTQSTKSKTTQKQTKTGTRKKKVATKDLIFKKFDTWTPEKVFRVEPPERDRKDFTSPPFVSGADEAEAARIKKLLFKKFDPTTSQAAATEPDMYAETDSKPFDSPVMPPIMPKQADPMATTMKFFIFGMVLLIALIVKVSASNRSTYSIKPVNTGVEIWQGIFAPMGRERLIALPGAALPESIQEVYTKQQAFPFVFNYYVKKADELLEKPGIPDFEGIKAYLNQAIPYGVTKKLRNVAASRLNNIDLMILLYKADVAASKETLGDYEAALQYLKQGAALDVDGSKSDLIKQKTESIQASMAALEQPKQEDAETPPSPK